MVEKEAVPVVAVDDVVNMKNVEESKNQERIIDVISNGIYRVGTTLGFTGMLGFAAGYAMKQAVKIALTIVGFTFLGMQTLSYCGYITINWKKVRKDCAKAFDSDGSGKVGAKDVKHYTRKFFNILAGRGAGATGLSAGVYMGLTRT